MTNFFRVGKIITTHGIKGEVKIFPTTDDIKRFDDLKSVYYSDKEDVKSLDTSNILYIESVKYVKNSPVLKLKGYDKIEDTTKLIGKNLYVERTDAVPLDQNEYYVMDLIGLNTYLDDKEYGKVLDIMKTKTQSLLVVSHDGKEILIPMQVDFVDTVDIEANKIILKTVEGLE